MSKEPEVFLTQEGFSGAPWSKQHTPYELIKYQLWIDVFHSHETPEHEVAVKAANSVVDAFEQYFKCA